MASGVRKGWVAVFMAVVYGGGEGVDEEGDEGDRGNGNCTT